MLKLYRRHIQPDNDGHGGCKHAAKGRQYTKCGCPIWIDGMHEGKRPRHSLDTFNWEVASKKLLELTTGADKKNSTVSDAVKDFLADRERRDLAESGTKKYREVLNPLLKFCEGRSITLVRALDLSMLKNFVETFTDSSLVQAKKIERLRTFMKHCMEQSWCENNPATLIRKPKVVNPPVVPFTESDQKAILKAIDQYPRGTALGTTTGRE
jgi:integrase